MGKIKPVDHHRQTSSRKNKTSQNCVWVPTIPSWEKEFCYKIGSFKWDDFLEAKKLTGYANKILEWNDSEAEEAFHRAKNRFFAKINNLPGPDDESTPGPDLYIDEIDSGDDEEIDPGLLDGILELDDDQEDEANNVNMNDFNDYVPDYYHIKIEDIKPTGWDVDFKELSGKHVLTGLIVGR